MRIYKKYLDACRVWFDLTDLITDGLEVSLIGCLTDCLLDRLAPGGDTSDPRSLGMGGVAEGAGAGAAKVSQEGRVGG